MCNKIFYATKSDCIKDIKIMKNSRCNRSNPSQNLQPYNCPGCNGWHVTSKPKKEAKRHKIYNRKLKKIESQN